MPDPQSCHTPVMLTEVLEHLDLKKGGIYVDGTLGMGGHSQAIIKAIAPQGKLIGIDRDPEALKMARERLSDFSQYCLFFHDNFCDLQRILTDQNISAVDGVLLDLGISSFQMDDPQRGFSLRNEGPLDMRMNTLAEISAFDLVNTLSEKEIAAVIKEYGEERYSGRVARVIVEERQRSPINSTKVLSQCVLKAMPYSKRPKHERIHPATRTFQALRIAVNRELESIEKFLEYGVNVLKPQGRLVIIAFHSLEDRIVKHKFRELAKEKIVRLVLKKPVYPTEEEIKNNSRARSARLRVVEKI